MRQKARAAAAAMDSSLLQAASPHRKRKRRSLIKKRQRDLVTTTPMVKSTNFKKPYQNTFMLDGVSDVKRWVFVSVQILYERPTEASYQDHLPGKTGGKTDQNIYADLPNQLKSNRMASYHKCKVSNETYSRVYVSSDGLDYVGNYKDYVLIDETKPGVVCYGTCRH